MAVAEDQAERWAAQSEAGEPPAVAARPARRLLGEFELLSELGRGGMGVVYRAWQPSLGRQVALKSLLHAGDPKAETRFRREIRALGAVEHPHLVKVFTSGSEGDAWFYAMELVEGVPLSAVCDRLHTRAASATEVDTALWRETVSGACQAAREAEMPLSDPPAPAPGPPAQAAGPDNRIPTGAGQGHPAPLPSAGRSYVRQVAELLRQAAEAAHALHEAGVVHRDVKPGNILVSADGLRAVLMDLGLAQLADDVEGRVTRTRQFIGTLRYASPQQIMAVGQVDRRSDVYGLGATLWELLTLRPLYGATDETPTPELMEIIQRQEPQRPRKYNPAIPRDLEAIAQKCLEKDANRRYATASELADELRRFLGGEPVRARPVSRAERSWRWARRNPGVAAGVATVFLLLLAVAVGSITAAVYARRAQQLDREEKVILQDLADLYMGKFGGELALVADDEDTRASRALLKQRLQQFLKEHGDEETRRQFAPILDRLEEDEEPREPVEVTLLVKVVPAGERQGEARRILVSLREGSSEVENQNELGPLLKRVRETVSNADIRIASDYPLNADAFARIGTACREAGFRRVCLGLPEYKKPDLTNDPLVGDPDIPLGYRNDRREDISVPGVPLPNEPIGIPGVPEGPQRSVNPPPGVGPMQGPIGDSPMDAFRWTTARGPRQGPATNKK